jgi:glycosyltransferase involved in cell wall biosynthesis
LQILLLTAYFPPDEHVGARRWGRLAKYLQRNGVSVRVIASAECDSEQDPEHQRRVHRVDIGRNLPDLLALRLSRLRPRSATPPSLRPLGAGGKPSATAAARRAIGKLLRFPDPHWFAWRAFANAALHAIDVERPSVIVATHPYALTLKAAAHVSQKTGIPWVADMRDGWSTYYFGAYASSPLARYALRCLERRTLRSACCVVTVTASMAVDLQVEPERVRVVPNCFDPEFALESPARAGFESGGALQLAFAGSLGEGHLLEPLLLAVRDLQLDPMSRRISISYFGDYFGVLHRAARQLGVPEELLIDRGYVPQRELREYLSGADLLVVLGFSGNFGKAVATAKIFDYLEAGRPVLGICDGKSELANVIKQTGAGFVTDSKDGVIAVIRSINRARVGARVAEMPHKQSLRGSPFGADMVAAQYERILRSAVDRKVGLTGTRAVRQCGRGH